VPRRSGPRHDRFMEFGVTGGSLEQQHTGCLVVGVYEGGRLSPSARELDSRHRATRSRRPWAAATSKVSSARCCS
jgi:hypothetical protein